MMSIPPIKELGHSHWQMQYTIPEQGAKEEVGIYEKLSNV
jgi:hypothetical protein